MSFNLNLNGDSTMNNSANENKRNPNLPKGEYLQRILTRLSERGLSDVEPNDLVCNSSERNEPSRDNTSTSRTFVHRSNSVRSSNTSFQRSWKTSSTRGPVINQQETTSSSILTSGPQVACSNVTSTTSVVQQSNNGSTSISRTSLQRSISVTNSSKPEECPSTSTLNSESVFISTESPVNSFKLPLRRLNSFRSSFITQKGDSGEVSTTTSITSVETSSSNSPNVRRSLSFNVREKLNRFRLNPKNDKTETSVNENQDKTENIAEKNTTIEKKAQTEILSPNVELKEKLKSIIRSNSINLDRKSLSPKIEHKSVVETFPEKCSIVEEKTIYKIKNPNSELIQEIENQFRFNTDKSVRKSTISSTSSEIDAQRSSSGASSLSEGTSEQWNSKQESEIFHALNEIVESEKAYIEGLNYALENYQPEVKKRDAPPKLKSQSYYLFGYIEQLYTFHKDTFYPKLLEGERDCYAVANAFIIFKKEFDLYTQYQIDYPERSRVMKMFSEFFEGKRIEIDDKLGLSSHIMKPTLRLIKYGQLIERIKMNLVKLENLQSDNEDIYLPSLTSKSITETLDIIIQAQEILSDLQQQSNDVLAIPQITRCPVSIAAIQLIVTGYLKTNKLLKTETFFTLLFENMIMFTEIKMEGTKETYIYQDHILLTEMKPPIQVNSTDFRIETSARTNPKIVQLRAPSEKHLKMWIDKINSILLEQLNQRRRIVESKTSMRRKNSTRDLRPEIEELPSTLNLRNQGRLIHRGKVTITKDKHTYVGEILFFQKIMIFATFKHTDYDRILVFEESIPTSDLYLDMAESTLPTQFKICCYSSPNNCYILRTETNDEKLAWTRCMPNVLNVEGYFSAPKDTLYKSEDIEPCE